MCAWKNELNYCGFIPLVLKKFLTALVVRTHTLTPFELISLMVIIMVPYLPTCDKLIMFPRGVFTEESYQMFYDSLMAVIGIDTFNMV
jgi:hypothetical protein